MSNTHHSSAQDVSAILEARHFDPFSFLGPHHVEGTDVSVVRSFQPAARSVEVVLRDDSQRFTAQRVHENGLFEAEIPGAFAGRPYDLAVTYLDNNVNRTADPYSFGVCLSDQDLHYFGEGKHQRLYDCMGAHVVTKDGVSGVQFAVWAPNAHRVSVVGDFNGWDGRVHPMRCRFERGVWEIFIPGVCIDAHYKYELIDAHGHLRVKSDPFAFFAQNGPQTASLTWDYSRFTWADGEWMKKRASEDIYTKPMSIYEVHLGSWKRKPGEDNHSLSYLELADDLIPYVKGLGFTHIELMPISEYPFDGSWGYQVTGYYAPTSRFGNPDDFREFVDRCHQAGLGVLVDWVPGHFPKDEHGLAKFDGTALFEHADPRLGEHQDWGTLIFNYGRNEVRNFLVANALFWLDQYHIDGLRVDAVASMLYLDYSREHGQWVPNKHGGRENLEAIDFMHELNSLCYANHPGALIIAEESTAWPGVSRPANHGGLGFGFKWNMGWMNDMLRYIAEDPIHRKYHHGSATFSMLYAYDENFILVISHDEVVHGKKSMLSKMPGDRWQQFANLRLFYAWMWAHPGKKLLFMGSEFGQWTEWSEKRSLDWHVLMGAEHSGLQLLVKELNTLYTTHPALNNLDHDRTGFAWLDPNDGDNSIFSFYRTSADGAKVHVVINATPVPRPGYRMGVAETGVYHEILNTDAAAYGGSNTVNVGNIIAEDIPWNGQPWSVKLTLPPLGVVFLEKV